MDNNKRLRTSANSKESLDERKRTIHVVETLCAVTNTVVNWSARLKQYQHMFIKSIISQWSVLSPAPQ